MDISADLHELTRCPVGLVSAGVKSILDIGRYAYYLRLMFAFNLIDRFLGPLNTLSVLSIVTET